VCSCRAARSPIIWALPASWRAPAAALLVQHESHLYNDEGDCAQQLSGTDPGAACRRPRQLHAGMKAAAEIAGAARGPRRDPGRRDLDRDAGAPH